MDAMPMPGAPIGIPTGAIELGGVLPGLLPSLLAALVASALPIVVSAIRRRDLGLSDVIGAATADGPFEWLGSLLLDVLAAGDSVRWYVADLVIRWRAVTARSLS
jgi:hypothetical protein